MPTKYIVAPDSEFWVVVASMRYTSVVVDSAEKAEKIAEEFRARGMEVVIYRELDLRAENPRLLPLEAESLKSHEPPH